MVAEEFDVMPTPEQEDLNLAPSEHSGQSLADCFGENIRRRISATYNDESDTSKPRLEDLKFAKMTSLVADEIDVEPTTKQEDVKLAPSEVSVLPLADCNGENIEGKTKSTDDESDTSNLRLASLKVTSLEQDSLHSDCGQDVDIANNEKVAVEFKGKSVRFSTVEIRNYPIILGDNPAVSRGPPITIDWKYMNTRVFKSLEDYERTECFLSRRVMAQMAMPPRYRIEILKSCGYTRHEMLKAAKEADNVKSNREKTVQRLHFSNIEEVAEKVRNYFKTPFTKKRKSGLGATNLSQDGIAHITVT